MWDYLYICFHSIILEKMEKHDLQKMQDRFHAAVSPYYSEWGWNDWLLSPTCFLTEKEKTIANSFGWFLSSREAREKNGVTLKDMEQLIGHLEGQLWKFYRWSGTRTLTGQRIMLLHKHRKGWLMEPISRQGLSPKLVRILKRVGIERVIDLLETGKETVRNLRGLGKQRFSEIKEWLEYYQCYGWW